MAISLKKGEGVNLSKEVKELQDMTVALGWSASTSGVTIDCDSFVFALQKGIRLTRKPGLLNWFLNEPDQKTVYYINSMSRDVIYYGNLHHENDCIIHHGDNLVGGAKGDCETISINLKDMPTKIESLLVGINIYNAYSKHQDFGKIKNCYARIIDNGTKKEICRYDLSNDYDGYTAVIMGQFVRQDDGWRFEASGEGQRVASIQELAEEFK